MKERQVTNMFTQYTQGKRPYVSPKWEVIDVAHTNFICYSIPLKKDELSGGGSSDYDEDEEKDGGTVEVNIGF